QPKRTDVRVCGPSVPTQRQTQFCFQFRSSSARAANVELLKQCFVCSSVPFLTTTVLYRSSNSTNRM
uniref:Uncharacterized protein n=1 Tax=Anopheles arabiensis TaxID=7173 RepID=A0A182HGE0_ANOAR